MNLLSDIITYVRRIIKSPSDAVITDNLIIDYINRFWIMDVDARVQLFDLKTKYQFQTTPGVDKYNMPLYNVQTQPGNQTIGSYPVYQGFLGPAYINGVPVSFQTQRTSFFNMFPNVVQYSQTIAVGNNTSGPYTIQFPFTGSTNSNNPPFNGIIRGHVDTSGIIAITNNTAVNRDPPLASSVLAQTQIPLVPVTSVESAVYFTSIDATGANAIVADSGQFLDTNNNCGLLMKPGNAPLGNLPLTGGYSAVLNTVNYLTGTAVVTFPVAIPSGNNINLQCYYFASGLPRAILFYNNVLTLRVPPALQYLVELEAYLTPAAFLNTAGAIQFGYMAEYIARGAARKILSDTGDMDQFAFYEPLFREQETLVWKRSQRQFTSTRTQTIYSMGMNQSSGTNYSGAGGTF